MIQLLYARSLELAKLRRSGDEAQLTMSELEATGSTVLSL